MQIVGYNTGVSHLTYDPTTGITGVPTDASLLIAENDAIRQIPLTPETELAYSLDDRHCAGTIKNHSHTTCDAETTPYCEDHSSVWPCARCTGNCGLPLDSCQEQHAVYLAAFAPATFKVGVTRLHRVPARLREQGADRAAVIHIVSNGRVAREVEQELTNTVPDRVPVQTKINGFHRTVAPSEWQSFLSDFSIIDEFTFDYELDLVNRPIKELLTTGTICGTKGRVLVLENAGNKHAVDLRDLIGYEIKPGSGHRDFQSDLSTYH